MSQKQLPTNPSSLSVQVVDSDRPNDLRSPLTPAVKPRTLKPKTRFTLEEAWRKAESQFKQDNDGKELCSFETGKDGVMQRWRQAYIPEDPEERRQSDQMAGILNNILNGVELVGAFAAQAGSMFFPPAGMCFNAISFLIDAPRKIQKVYDGLRALFEEVEKFLVKFKIYKRMDDKFGLDEDLIVNTNKLLISFVRICGLATRLLQGGRWTSFKTAFKVILFRDESGVPGELANFRELATDQSMLTGTVTLEHVLQSEESIKQVLSDAEELKSGVSVLIAASNDEKTKFVNKDRLERIQQKLFKNKPLGGEVTFAPTTDELLIGTFDAIKATAEYQAWVDVSNPAPSVLVIDGPTGSGKSHLLEAVKDHLDAIREDAGRDDSSTYVAVFSFTEKRFNTSENEKPTGSSKGAVMSRLPDALKSLAWQVANQSTSYAKELADDLQKSRQNQSGIGIDNLWPMLRLSKFKVPRGSVLFILLDGVGKKESKHLEFILKQITEEAKDIGEKPSIKILLTLDASLTFNELDQDQERPLPRILARNITQKLMLPFARNEMQLQNLFQDSDGDTWRRKQQILKTITDGDDLSFTRIRLKLNRLKDGIVRGLPRDIILASIREDASIATAEGEGKRILKDLENELSAGDIALLNSILMWLMTTYWKYMYLPSLEAALRLSGANLPIESLNKKITSRFASALTCSGSIVSVVDAVSEYLTEAQNDNRSGVSEDEALITLNLSIKNATEKTVKQFFWDLNEQMINGKFDFNQNRSGGTQIRYDKLTAQLAVTSLCFKIMNEGWNKNTEAFLDSAYCQFPMYLQELQNMEKRISTPARKQIGEDLVSFLNDPYQFEQRHQDYGNGSWMWDSDYVNAIKFWLNDTATIQQLTLKEQRWVKNAVNTDNGVLYFMHDQAVSIGKRWLSDRKCNSYTMFDWIDSYLTAIDMKVGEPAPEEAEGDTTEDAAQQPAEIGDQAMPSEEEHDQNEKIEGQETAHQQRHSDGVIGSAVAEKSSDGVGDEAAPATQASAESANLVPGAKEEQKQTEDTSSVSFVDLPATNGVKEQPSTERNGTLDNGILKRDMTDSESMTNNHISQTEMQEPLVKAEGELESKKHSTSPEATSDQEKTTEQLHTNVEGVNEDNNDDDRIARALKWVEKHTNITVTPEYHLNLGRTHVTRGEYKEALNCYQQALKTERLRPYALIGMAKAEFWIEKEDDAIEHATNGLNMLQQLADDGELDEIDIETYLEHLEEFAGLASNRNKKSKALEWIEELLKRKPDDVTNRWALLRLQCHVDESQDSAVKLLSQWSASEDEFGGESAALSMLEMAERGELESQVRPVVLTIRNEKLRTAISKIATDALKLASAAVGTYAHCQLLYLRGLVSALSTDDDIRNQAVTLWEKALTTLSLTEDDYSGLDVSNKMTGFLIKLKFDALRLNLISDPQISDQERKETLQGLQEYVRTKLHPTTNFERARGVDEIDSFIIAFASLANLPDDARRLCKDDMGQALEILSDSDPDNDSIGFQVLARVFSRLGDKVGLLSAFSLADRTVLRCRLNGSNPEDLEEAERDNFTFYRACDNCSNSIYSSDKDGFWWCQCCPNFDLCPSCKVEYANGKAEQEMCSASHVPLFQHLVHSDYSKEELEPGKVRVGWEYKENADGSFTREGGQVVEVGEWVEQLRTLWGLPKPFGDTSRAQK